MKAQQSILRQTESLRELQTGRDISLVVALLQYKRDVSSNLYQLSSYCRGAPQQHPPPLHHILFLLLPCGSGLHFSVWIFCTCVWQPAVNIRELTENLNWTNKEFLSKKNISNSVSHTTSARKHNIYTAWVDPSFSVVSSLPSSTDYECPVPAHIVSTSCSREVGATVSWQA